MRRTLSFLPIVLLLISINLLLAAEDQKYTLRYKFTPGEVIRTEVLHRATIDTTIQGTTQTAETRSGSIKSWKVTAVTPAGETTFVHSVESVDMWQRMKGRAEVRYNSQTDKDAPAGYEEAARAVGVPLTEITINSAGGVVRRVEKHDNVSPGVSPLTLVLPESPVTVAETWSHPQEVTVDVKGVGAKKIALRQLYTLKSVDADIAVITIESQLMSPVNDPTIEVQLIQWLNAGEAKFDIKAGRVISQQVDLDRRVIGFNGPASSMHCLTRVTEKLLPPAAATAKAPTKKAVKRG